MSLIKLTVFKKNSHFFNLVIGNVLALKLRKSGLRESPLNFWEKWRPPTLEKKKIKWVVEYGAHMKYTLREEGI